MTIEDDLKFIVETYGMPLWATHYGMVDDNFEFIFKVGDNYFYEYFENFEYGIRCVGDTEGVIEIPEEFKNDY